MKKYLLMAYVLTFMLLHISTVNATVLKFDDITLSLWSDVYDYNGLNWVNFGVFRKDYDDYVKNSIVSGNYTLVSNMHGQYDSSVYKTGGTFDFTGAYITSYYFPENPMTFIGTKNGNILYNNTFYVSAKSPTAVQFNYTGIDTLYVKAGHVNASKGYEYVNIDNFVINEPFKGIPVANLSSPAPESSSSIIMLLGIIGLFIINNSKRLKLNY